MSWMKNSLFTLYVFVYLPIFTPAVGVFNDVAATASGWIFKNKT